MSSTLNPCRWPTVLTRHARSARDNLARLALAEAGEATTARPLAHAEAVYLAVSVLGAPIKAVARVTGSTPRSVRRALERVDCHRDAPAYDRALDEIELTLLPQGEAA